MTKKQELACDRAHLNALPVLLQPLIECMNSIPEKTITSLDARKIISQWDDVRDKWKKEFGFEMGIFNVP